MFFFNNFWNVLQRWRLAKVVGYAIGPAGEKIGYNKFCEYFDFRAKQYEDGEITKYHLNIIAKQFDNFKIVTDVKIVKDLCNSYFLMVHLGVIKITITEWDNLPLTKLMQHYEVYQELSKQQK